MMDQPGSCFWWDVCAKKTDSIAKTVMRATRCWRGKPVLFAANHPDSGEERKPIDPDSLEPVGDLKLWNCTIYIRPPEPRKAPVDPASSEPPAPSVSSEASEPSVPSVPSVPSARSPIVKRRSDRIACRVKAAK